MAFANVVNRMGERPTFPVLVVLVRLMGETLRGVIPSKVLLRLTTFFLGPLPSGRRIGDIFGMCTGDGAVTVLLRLAEALVAAVFAASVAVVAARAAEFAAFVAAKVAEFAAVVAAFENAVKADIAVGVCCRLGLGLGWSEVGRRPDR